MMPMMSARYFSNTLGGALTRPLPAAERRAAERDVAGALVTGAGVTGLGVTGALPSTGGGGRGRRCPPQLCFRWSVAAGTSGTSCSQGSS